MSVAQRTIGLQTMLRFPQVSGSDLHRWAEEAYCRRTQVKSLERITGASLELRTLRPGKGRRGKGAARHEGALSPGRRSLSAMGVSASCAAWFGKRQSC